MSIRENNKNRIRMMAGKVVRKGRVVLCSTEISGGYEGLVLIGEGECRVTVILGEKENGLVAGKCDGEVG